LLVAQEGEGRVQRQVHHGSDHHRSLRSIPSTSGVCILARLGSRTWGSTLGMQPMCHRIQRQSLQSGHFPIHILGNPDDKTGISIEGSVGNKDGSVGIFTFELIEEHIDGIFLAVHVV